MYVTFYFNRFICTFIIIARMTRLDLMLDPYTLDSLLRIHISKYIITPN